MVLNDIADRLIQLHLLPHPQGFYCRMKLWNGFASHEFEAIDVTPEAAIEGVLAVVAASQADQ